MGNKNRSGLILEGLCEVGVVEGIGNCDLFRFYRIRIKIGNIIKFRVFICLFFKLYFICFI